MPSRQKSGVHPADKPDPLDPPAVPKTKGPKFARHNIDLRIEVIVQRFNNRGLFTQGHNRRVGTIPKHKQHEPGRVEIRPLERTGLHVWRYSVTLLAEQFPDLYLLDSVALSNRRIEL